MLCGIDEPIELPFLDAINLIECKPEEKRLSIPKEFFQKLEKNKMHFDEILTQSEEEISRRRGRSIERELLDLLKSFRREAIFKDEEQNLISKLIRAFDDGVIARKKSKKILKEIEKEKNTSPIMLLTIFRKNISDKYLDETIREKLEYGGKREIILSEFLF